MGEPFAAIRLRTLPWAYQMAVISCGSLLNARNPTGALIARMELVTRGVLVWSMNFWAFHQDVRKIAGFEANPTPSKEPEEPEDDEIDSVIQQLKKEEDAKKTKKRKRSPPKKVEEDSSAKKASLICDWRSNRPQNSYE